jgi:hypothetical protein
MNTNDDRTIWHTPARNCPACGAQRRHAREEVSQYHYYSGHGYDRGRWTDPMLDPLEPLELRGEPDPEENS